MTAAPRRWILDLQGGAGLYAPDGTLRVALPIDERVSLDGGARVERVPLGHLLEWLPRMPPELPAREVACLFGAWLGERLGISGPGICTVPPAFGTVLRLGLRRGLLVHAEPPVAVVDAETALRLGALAHPEVASLCRPGSTLGLCEGVGSHFLWFKVHENPGRAAAPWVESLPEQPRPPHPAVRVITPPFAQFRLAGARLLGGGERADAPDGPTLVRRAVLVVRRHTGSLIHHAVLPTDAPVVSFAFRAPTDEPVQLLHRYQDQGRGDETQGGRFLVPRGAGRVALRADRTEGTVTAYASLSQTSAPPGELASFSWGDLAPPAVL